MLDLKTSFILGEIHFPFLLTSLDSTRLIKREEEVINEEMYSEVIKVELCPNGMESVFVDNNQVISNAITEKMRDSSRRSDYRIISYINSHFDTRDEIVKAVLRGISL